MEKTPPPSKFQLAIQGDVEDDISGELMTKAVTLIPCGHTFNEDTATQCLAGNKLCPLDRQPIDRYVPNYTIRHLAETSGAPPKEEESYNPESESFFIKGKKASEEGNIEGAIECLLEALRISPYYEKAQGYLEFCLQKVSLQKGPKENRYDKEEYTNLLLHLLEEPAILANASLSQLLGREAEQLIEQDSVELSEQSIAKYKWAKKLLIDQKVSQFVAKKLETLLSSNSSHSSQTIIPAPTAQKTAPISVSSSSTSSITHLPQLSVPAVPEMAFGKAKWEKYFGDIGEEPPLPANIEEILDSECPFWKGKKVRDTHLLILIPQSIDGIPLTLDNLQEIIKKPKNSGNSVNFEYYHNLMKGEIGKQGITASYWVLIIKDVIPTSLNKTFPEQKTLIKTGYDVPGALDMATGILMHYILTGEKLYSNGVYTRCKESLSNGYRLWVGSFSHNGLCIHYGGSDLSKQQVDGLSCVRKLLCPF